MTVPTNAASMLTSYLTERSGSGKSTLEIAVQEHITKMAREIAAEMVAATPALRERLEALTQDVIRRALADDRTLYRGMVTAVAEALTTRKHDHDEYGVDL